LQEEVLVIHDFEAGFVPSIHFYIFRAFAAWVVAIDSPLLSFQSNQPTLEVRASNATTVFFTFNACSFEIGTDVIATTVVARGEVSDLTFL